MNSALPPDIALLQICLTLVSGLFLLALIRIFRLSGANRRMRADTEKLDKQAALQQIEVTAIHHDAMSWRAKTQRQFDALRADLSHRLQQSDQGGLHALKDLEEAHQQALAAALGKITVLEAALAAKPVAVSPPPPPAFVPPKPPPPSLPALPAMETLRVQSLETELAAAKAELAQGKQQNAVLQRALLLARRKAPATAGRKSPRRSKAHCA